MLLIIAAGCASDEGAMIVRFGRSVPVCAEDDIYFEIEPGDVEEILTSCGRDCPGQLLPAICSAISRLAGGDSTEEVLEGRRIPLRVSRRRLAGGVPRTVACRDRIRRVFRSVSPGPVVGRMKGGMVAATGWSAFPAAPSSNPGGAGRGARVRPMAGQPVAASAFPAGR